MNYEISINRATDKIMLHKTTCSSIHIHSNLGKNQEYIEVNNIEKGILYIKKSNYKNKGICSKCLVELKNVTFF